MPQIQSPNIVACWNATYIHQKKFKWKKHQLPHMIVGNMVENCLDCLQLTAQTHQNNLINEINIRNWPFIDPCSGSFLCMLGVYPSSLGPPHFRCSKASSIKPPWIGGVHTLHLTPIERHTDYLWHAQSCHYGSYAIVSAMTWHTWKSFQSLCWLLGM